MGTCGLTGSHFFADVFSGGCLKPQTPLLSRLIRPWAERATELIQVSAFQALLARLIYHQP